MIPAAADTLWKNTQWAEKRGFKWALAGFWRGQFLCEVEIRHVRHLPDVDGCRGGIL